MDPDCGRLTVILPQFKVKERAEMTVKGHYTKLNTEGYGGMLCAPWFDRPLSLAGRAVVRTKDGIQERLVKIDRDLLLIPSLAIHMNRKSMRDRNLTFRRICCLCCLPGNWSRIRSGS